MRQTLCQRALRRLASVVVAWSSKLANKRVALAALLLAAGGQAALTYARSLWAGLVLYGLALLLLYPTLRRLDPPQGRAPGEDRPQGQQAASTTWRTWLVFGLGAAASFLLLALALKGFGEPTIAVRPWLYFAGSVLVVLATLHFAGPRRAEASGRSGHDGGNGIKPSALAVAGVAALTGLGFLLRWRQLESLPFGLWEDEAQHGLLGRQLAATGSSLRVYLQEINITSPFVTLQGWSERWLGPSLLAVRLPSAIAGALAIPVFYLLARRLLGTWTALVASFLLATSFWHLALSRSGMPPVTAPFVATFAVYLLLVALDSRKPFHYGLAGLALGASAWGYQALRGFPVVVLLFLAYVLWLRRRSLKALLPGVAVYLGVALVVVTPVAQYAILHPDQFWDRTQTVSLLKGQSLPSGLVSAAENLRDHLGMFNYRGDQYGRHNIIDQPMLDYGTGLLAIVGFLYALIHLRKAAFFLMLAWFLVMLLPGVLGLRGESPHALRTSAALPPTLLFSALGLRVLWRVWTPGLGRARLRLCLVGLLAALAAITWLNYNAYFHQWRRDPRAIEAFFPKETVIAKHLRRLGPETLAYSTPLWKMEVVQQYLAPGTAPPKDFTTTNDIRPGYEAVVFIDPKRTELLGRVEECYPSAQVEPVYAPATRTTVLYIVHIPASAACNGPPT